jgi:hypothetical protein
MEEVPLAAKGRVGRPQDIDDAAQLGESFPGVEPGRERRLSAGSVSDDLEAECVERLRDSSVGIGSERCEAFPGARLESLRRIGVERQHQDLFGRNQLAAERVAGLGDHGRGFAGAG